MEKPIKKYKILVVEDTTVTRNNIVAELREYIKNVEVFTAATKSRGLQLYNKNPDIDLAIIDLDINSGDDPGHVKSNTELEEQNQGATLNDAIGLGLINEIRSKNKSIILIAFTNSESEAIIDQLNRASAYHHIKRTFTNRQLKLITLVIQLLSINKDE